MNKLNQQGLGHILTTILVLTVIGAIGLVGYRLQKTSSASPPAGAPLYTKRGDVELYMANRVFNVGEATTQLGAADYFSTLLSVKLTAPLQGEIIDVDVDISGYSSVRPATFEYFVATGNSDKTSCRNYAQLASQFRQSVLFDVTPSGSKNYQHSAGGYLFPNATHIFLCGRNIPANNPPGGQLTIINIDPKMSVKVFR